MPHHLYKKHHLKKHHTLRERRLVDRLTLIAAMVGPISTIPQAIKVFVSNDQTSIALSTWIMYDITTLVWIWYAVVHKERIILVAQMMWLVIQTIIIVGALQQGARW